MVAWLELLFDDEGPRPSARMRGWLLKKRRRDLGIGWSRRFFVLDVDELELAWFRSKISINPSGSIGLRSIGRVAETDKYKHIVHVESTERSLTLRAVSRADATYWVQGISLHVANLKPLVVDDPPDEDTKPAIAKECNFPSIASL